MKLDDLTLDEKAVILANREVAKAKGLLKQKTYDQSIVDGIAYAKKNLTESIAEDTKLGLAYIKFFEQIKAVSPNFELVKESFFRTESVTVHKLDYIDEDGNDMYRDEYDNSIPYNELRETVKTLKLKTATYSIVFTGDVPKDEDGDDYEYQIKVDEHGSGYKKAFKMTYDGNSVPYPDYNRKYTNAKSVVGKVTNAVQKAFNTIEQENAEKSLKERAMAEIKAKYPNSLVEEASVKIYSSYVDAIQITISDDVIVKLMFDNEKDEDYNETGNIRFWVSEIDGLTELNPNDLIKSLTKLTK